MWTGQLHNGRAYYFWIAIQSLADSDLVIGRLLTSRPFSSRKNNRPAHPDEYRVPTLTLLVSSPFLFQRRRELSSGCHRREFEGLNGLGLVVSNVEDGIQFRNLHQVVDLIREFEQFQFSLLLPY